MTSDMFIPNIINWPVGNTRVDEKSTRGSLKRLGAVREYTLETDLMFDAINNIEIDPYVMVELRANVRIPASNGTLYGEPILNERIILDINVETFGVDVR